MDAYFGYWLALGEQLQAQGEETMFGIAPRYDEINWNGLDFSKQQFKQVTARVAQHWGGELHLHDELFDVRTRHEQRLTTVPVRMSHPPHHG